MPSVLTTVYLRITAIEPSYDYDQSEVALNVYHRNQLVAEVMADDLEPTYKVPLKTEFEKISFELRSLLDDERVLGTASFTYDFIKLAEPGKEYFQKVYMNPLGDNPLDVKDWGRDAKDVPRVEIGIEVDKFVGQDQIASSTSKSFANHYRDETAYIGSRPKLVDETRYMATVQPIETRTSIYRNDGYLSPNRRLYDTGVRVDGTQQTIYRKEGKQIRSTRHGSVGRDMLTESFEVRGTRPSKFAKVRSAKSIKVTRDTPQHREQLKVALKRLISTLDNKNDDLVKDTENRLKILDWLFKNKAQYDNVYSGGGSDFSDQATLVSEVDMQYNEVYKLDQDDLYSLRQDVERMRDDLNQAERELMISRETRERLLKFFGRANDDLEILEEEIIEDSRGRMTSKKLINRYIRREDKEIQEVRDENLTVYKQLEGIKQEIHRKLTASQSSGLGIQFEDLFKGISMKINGVIGGKEIQNETLKGLNDEYLALVDKNLQLKMKRLETENEVATLREFISNDKELKLRLEEASLRAGKRGPTPSNPRLELQKKLSTLQKERQDLERQLKGNNDRIRAIEDRVGNSGQTDALERLVKRLENNLVQRNDLHNDIVRSASSNVKTIDLDVEEVGNPRDDQKVADLLDEIQRKERDINALLDLKEEADRKRRVSKKKNELSYNLSKDIADMDKRVTEAENDNNRMMVDAKNNRNIDVELENKEIKIRDQEKLLDKLDEERAQLEDRLENGVSAQEFDQDEEVEIERLRSKLSDINRRIENARRSTDLKKAEQKKRLLQEKEEYIIELQRQLSA